jgi:hypothetical protein
VTEDVAAIHSEWPRNLSPLILRSAFFTRVSKDGRGLNPHQLMVRDGAKWRLLTMRV